MTLPAGTPPVDQPGPRVSVVTPFYNTAAYLAECIESVLAQSHRNFEYILADNRSTDDSLAIARRYAALDSRIRVVAHEEFIDQDSNYNRALRLVAPDSRYVKIAQADDTLLPDCLAAMVDLAERNPSVGIVGCCFITGDVLAGHGLPFDREVFTGVEACRTRLLHGGTYFGSPTCLLYRADIVRTRPAFFPLNETNADTVACLDILATCDFGRVRQVLCHLRRGNPSVSDRLRRNGAAAFLNYALVEKFGPRYLAPGEFSRRRAQLRAVYLRVLARGVTARRGPEFWQFHRDALATVGQSLPTGAIARTLATYLLGKATNPGTTLSSLVDRLRRR
ncbi:MAG: glycosyltransferase family 2 protein [Gammaproteobacteria bacterium]|nr:glycosyltransferase family 2 protein [Gammaproteobacteria bacterium]